MARDIFHRRFGNPVLVEHLPKDDLELELPVAPLPAAKTRELQLRWLILLLKYGFLAAFAAELFAWLGGLELVIAIGLLVVVALSPQRIALLVLLGIVAGTNSHSWLYSLAVIGPYVGCLAFSIAFALHHVYIVSAFPVPYELSKRLRTVLALFLGYPWAGLLLLPMVFLATPLSVCLAPRRSFRAFNGAWRSWITYDFDACPSAGITISPAGKVTRRYRLLLASAVLASFSISSPVAGFYAVRDHALGITAYEEHSVRLNEEVKAHPAQADDWSTPRHPIFYDGAFKTPLKDLHLDDLILGIVFLAIPHFGGLVLIVICTFVTTASTSLVLDWFCRQHTEPSPPEDVQYERIHARVRHSKNQIEAKSVYVGRNSTDHSPVLVPISAFTSHAWILGGSGGGKSAALMRYLEQFASMGNCSIINLDLKADTPEPLESLRSAALYGRSIHQTNYPIKWFSNRVGDTTFAFSPFQQKCWHNLTPVQKADFVGAATATVYSESYGQGYYSAAVLHVLTEAIRQNPSIATPRELALALDQLLSGHQKSSIPNKLRGDAQHVLIKLQKLAELDALNVAPSSGKAPDVLANAIDLSSVFEQPQIFYFGLPCAIGPSSSADIARLVIYSLMLTAASLRRRPIQVFLVIDEFQRVIASNLEFVLQTARAFNIGVILANQSIQDLQQGSINLLPAVESCTTFRQYFRLAHYEDLKRVVDASGHAVDYSVSETFLPQANGNAIASVRSEQITSYLCQNEAMLSSAHPRQSIIQLTENAGYAPFGGFPVSVESQMHINPKEYQRRKNTAWPGPALGTMIQGSSEPPPASGAAMTLTPQRPSPVISIQTISSPKKPKGHRQHHPRSKRHRANP